MAAVYSTTPTSVYIPRERQIPSPNPILIPTHYYSSYPTTFVTQPRRFYIFRSSGNASGETAAKEADSWEEVKEGESSIEAPTGPPSLISALNVERALRGIPITDVDHYGRLGIARGCPFDQVAVAYNSKAEEVKNQGLEEDQLSRELELLKESYAILSSEEERRIYDWSLARTQNPDKYVWPFEADITQIPRGTPPPQEPEDEGPTRLVGYFFLGWILLSFVFSVVLNR